MAPVFPTTLAIVGDAFPRMTGTAIGFVITCGWTGLAVSSRIIGDRWWRSAAVENSTAGDSRFGRPDGGSGSGDPKRVAIENSAAKAAFTLAWLAQR
jgi:hypothetical protein